MAATVSALAVLPSVRVVGRVPSQSARETYCLILKLRIICQISKKISLSGTPNRHPSATSSTIITLKPTAKNTVPTLECCPCDISGISSSTTTYSMAPAAKLSR